MVCFVLVAEELSVNVGAGNFKADQVAVQRLTVEPGTGNVSVSGSVDGDVGKPTIASPDIFQREPLPVSECRLFPYR